jgi:hypothetical protein
MSGSSDIRLTAPGTPPVTVVMPTRNQAGFIAQAIESVLAQGIDGLELCVQDGDSTDGTQALLAALASRHPGLRWVSEPDSGPADAVNRAVARARGTIIGWLNSDDLYTPGAVARALAYMEAHPQHVMVYGEGGHIDAEGRPLGRYPTRDAATPLAAWADGCHICQPTAFFRRDVFLALGGLDTSLRTAFDYDFWLRVFKAHPGAAGHLPVLQARSRLHAGAITLRLREQVALEALLVIRRHLGPAPAHWLLTHFDEVQADLPFDGGTEAPTTRLLRLVGRAERDLSAAALATLRTRLASHRALRLATPHVYVAVHADGWAPPTLDLRVLQTDPPHDRLKLTCRHTAPGGAALRLELRTAGAQAVYRSIAAPGPFELTLPLEDLRPGAQIRLQVHCLNPFVPAQIALNSSDTRELAFLVERATLMPVA